MKFSPKMFERMIEAIDEQVEDNSRNHEDLMYLAEDYGSRLEWNDKDELKPGQEGRAHKLLYQLTKMYHEIVSVFIDMEAKDFNYIATNIVDELSPYLDEDDELQDPPPWGLSKGITEELVDALMHALEETWKCDECGKPARSISSKGDSLCMECIGKEVREAIESSRQKE